MDTAWGGTCCVMAEQNPVFGASHPKVLRAALKAFVKKTKRGQTERKKFQCTDGPLSKCPEAKPKAGTPSSPSTPGGQGMDSIEPQP